MKEFCPPPQRKTLRNGGKCRKELHIAMKTKVFIDGSEGTTGLRINERFQKRDDIELLHINPELRKDPEERKKMINASDITFLCLPDEEAKESL